VHGQRLVERMLSGIHLHGAGAGRYVLNKKFGPLLMPLATAGKKACEKIFGTPQPAAAGIGTVGRAGAAVRVGTKVAGGGGPAAPGTVATKAKKVLRDAGKKKKAPAAEVAGSGAHNINARENLSSKLRELEKAQDRAAKKRDLPDRRVRYYEHERPAKTPGPTRGNARTTEYDPKTGRVRSWEESYNHNGEVTRVHPKSINGQQLKAQHYPPTGAEK